MPDGVLNQTEKAYIALPSVTLVAVTSVALSATMRALMQSLRFVHFGQVLWLSDQPVLPERHAGITWRKIDRLDSREAYSQFMLHDLAEHISTTHVLTVQWDGYVLNPAGWSDDFLEYDYIGAPWPQFQDAHRVGNGGFSLRSVRLLKACRELPRNTAEAEDIAICRTHRALLEQGHGLQFAPEPVARRLSYERTPATGAEFGFHGVFNLARIMPRSAFDDLVRSLEPSVINLRERRELFRWACRAGRPGLAAQMVRRGLWK